MSLVEFENDRRAMYKTAAGKLLCMCQERADIMYSVKETARKILCPTESDEMNIKRITRYFTSVPNANYQIEIIKIPQSVNVHTDRDWASQPQPARIQASVLCNGKRNPLCMVTNTAVSEPELRRSGIGCPDNWNCRRHGDEHSLKELGREVTLVNHVNSQSAKALASMRGLGRMKHANAGIHVRARCRGE